MSALLIPISPMTMKGYPFTRYKDFSGRTVAFRLILPQETDRSGIVRVKRDDIYLHGTRNIDMWWRDKTSNGQLWYIEDAPYPGYFKIRNKETLLYLDGSGGRASAWHWTGYDRQYWKIVNLPDCVYCSIENKLPPNPSDDPNNRFLCGSLKGVTQWHWINMWHQKWAVIDEDELLRTDW